MIARGVVLIIVFAGGTSMVAALVTKAFGGVAFVIGWIVRR
jgi:hypothetical protein